MSKQENTYEPNIENISSRSNYQFSKTYLTKPYNLNSSVNEDILRQSNYIYQSKSQQPQNSKSHHTSHQIPESTIVQFEREPTIHDDEIITPVSFEEN